MPAALKVRPGDRYNNLTVIREIKERGKHRKFKFRCDCGNTIEALLNTVRSNHSKSCGCSRDVDIKKGDKFGKLTVVKEVERLPRGDRCCEFVCDCGNRKVLSIKVVMGGGTKSCGCLRKPHGLSNNKTYEVWRNMIDRCYNDDHKYYDDYGGRGIMVCRRWYEDPAALIKWNDSLPEEKRYKPGLWLDRIDNDYHYCPSNCRWTTPIIQSNNRHNTRMIMYKGEMRPVGLVFRHLNKKNLLKVPFDVAYKRYAAYGWSFKDAVSIPVQRRVNCAV
jgi:hypothetical protein